MADKRPFVMTPEFRVSFPEVFTPRASDKPGRKPKFTLTMLFPKGADLSVLKAEAEAAAREKWGENLPKKLKSPFLDQGDYDYAGYEPGAVFIRTSSTVQPFVVDQRVQPIIDPSEFYAGCYARAKVRAFAWEEVDEKTKAVINRGVSFGLGNVQKVREGERFGGGSRPENDFEPVEDAGTGASTDSLFG